MAPMYYRNAAAAVVCFDGIDQRTFQTMRTWVEELRANVDDKKLVIAIAIAKRVIWTRIGGDGTKSRRSSRPRSLTRGAGDVGEERRGRARALRDGSRGVIELVGE